MVATVRSHNAQPVIVAFPISDHYYANFDSPTDYQDYRDSLQRFADELDVPLWDMEESAAAPFGDDEFGDLNHLNRAGAERLSTLLAGEYAQLIAESSGQPSAGVNP